MVRSVLANGGESGDRETVVGSSAMVPVGKNQGDSRRSNAKLNPKK